ncbi:MAG: CHAT domain-containing protein, partial [Prochlorothrix sp.]|nr:CHAT domain-containing protein [Prochlorothrix sp.]
STAYSANTIAGSYPVTSTVASTPLSTTFSLTNLADAPSLLAIDTGNNQITTIDSPFPSALSVRVTDQYGNPVAGVAINFTVQPGVTGATGFLNSPAGVSDASGLVRTTLAANGEQGRFQVVATAAGLNSSAIFNLQNTIFTETRCPPTCDDSGAGQNTPRATLAAAPDELPVLTNAVVTTALDNTTFATAETLQIAAFSNYLNIPAPGPLTVEEAQTIIRERDRETGTTTAYITSRFTPATVSNPTTVSTLTPSSGKLSQVSSSPTSPPHSRSHPSALAASPQPTTSSRPDRGTKALDPLSPWIGQLPGGFSANPDDRLEVIVITAAGEPQIKRLPVTRQQVIFLSQQLQENLDKPIGVYKRQMETLYGRIFAPLEAELQSLGVDHLLLSLGDDLRGIPWGALYDGEQFLVEKYSVGVTPSLSLTDTEFVSLRDRAILAMGAAEFTNQNPLPAVPIELAAITAQFNSPSYFLNQDFTEGNLRQEREQQLPGIIHLATHANFLPGDLNQSYIQLWGDETISLSDIDSFQWFTDPPVELLVLSACRTAIGDRQAELGFGGLAVKAGVKSALASLWYVSDAATLALMTEFYRNLQNPEVTTKGKALQKAQIALIRGDISIEAGQLRGGGTRSPYAIPLPEGSDTLTAETLGHPYYWAAFTLIGSPW